MTQQIAERLAADIQAIHLVVRRLTLKNFKGCRDLALEASGDLNIFGDNATGKTTVADAFYWLLFGKDSQGRADFEIKTLDEDGQAIPNLDHSVEAELLLPGNKPLTLKKTFREVYTKRRGSVQSEFTGHTTDYLVNGVPVQKKEYDDWIAAICDEGRFRLLTDPRAFNEGLHWQDRRKILLEICGDVSDADVISANSKLADLPAILGDHSLDDYRKIAAARRKAINDELRTLPARIDELRRSLPDEAKAPTDIAALEKELADLKDQRLRAESGGEIANLTKQLREAEAKRIEIENDLRRLANSGKADAEAKLLAKRREHSAAVAEVERLEAQVKSTRTSIDALNAKLTALREQGTALNALTFEFTGADTCAACGQSLPADRVEAARQKALEEFNKNKSQRLEHNIAEGKALKAQQDELAARLKTLESQLADAEAKAEALRIEGVELKKLADAAETAAPKFEENADWRRVTAEIDALTAAIASVRNSNAELLAAIDKAIAPVESQLADRRRIEAEIKVRNENLTRIAELEAQEKMLSKEFELLERNLFLCEEFVKTKVSMLTDRINSKFELARFKLFNELVNGGIEECCETMYEGVPFGSLNHGARLNVGLDIINTLADHYGFAPTIFIDNAESVTSILPTRGQQIRLVVSATDKKLRIEAA